MRISRWHASICAVAALATNCTAAVGDPTETDSRVSTSSSPLRRAELVATDQMLGVAEVGSDQGACTGTVIGPETVLTAGHCFCTADFVGGNICTSAAEVRLRPNPNSGGVILHGIADVHPGYNPSWIDQAIDGDLAVITLTDGVVPNYTPPYEIADGVLPIDSIVRLAGYGLVGPNCDYGNDDFQQLYTDTTDIDDYQNGHDIMEFDDHVYCHGDSGGPVLGNDGRQYAVASFTSVRWDKAPTTAGAFDWIKGHMCKSSRYNQCTGDGNPCDCSGRNDILWTNPAGDVEYWVMDGATRTGSQFIGTLDGGWSLVGTGDFDGDGHTDTLLRNSNGGTGAWLMLDGQVVGWSYFGGEDPSWTVEGIGDFDGDGRADVLVVNTSGRHAIRFDGSTTHLATIGTVALTWSVAGVGDFDGDGHADIFWRENLGPTSSSNRTAIWYMSGGTRVASTTPPSVPRAAVLSGIGDLDGDLRADVVWSGMLPNTLVVWFDGANVNNRVQYANTPTTIDPAWKVAAVGDFDYDGRDDVVWRNSTTGATSVWTLVGARFKNALALPNFDPSWRVLGLLHEATRPVPVVQNCTPGESRSCCGFAQGCGCFGDQACVADGAGADWGPCVGSTPVGHECQ